MNKNKILVNDDVVELIKSDENIIVSLSDKLDFYDIVKMNIKVLKDTNIEIEYKNKEETKLNIEIEVEDNVNVSINEISLENKIKVQYKYYLKAYSNLIMNKFYDCDEVKELDIINLNGVGANIDYNLKTLCKNKQKYDIMIYHNFKETKSNVINKAITLKDGEVTFNVTGIAYNKIKECVLNQDNKIINMNDKNNIINPILLIEENDTSANHSAYIGKFNEEEIFYLQSRGITYEESLKLLIKGFILEGKENKKVEKLIDKYWR